MRGCGSWLAPAAHHSFAAMPIPHLPHAPMPADPPDEIHEWCAGLSRALAALGLRHRMELYVNDDSQTAAYFHHEWPSDTG
jgi:hypothetical protein